MRVVILALAFMRTFALVNIARVSRPTPWSMKFKWTSAGTSTNTPRLTTRVFSSSTSEQLSSAALRLEAQIKEVGDAVRELKKRDDPDKDAVSSKVAELKALKESFEEVAGRPFDVKKKKKAKPQQQKQPPSQKGEENEMITPRAEDYSKWYQDVVYASELVDQSPVRGCMVIKPWGMAVWDAIRDELDASIKATGAQNAYFPLFIPLSFLSKEAEHVEGFAKECAVVTHHRLTAAPQESDGDDGGGGAGKLIADPAAKLEEPLIVRPTSETVIWHMFGKWIKTYRELPLKLNQWANVVRWELRTRPFLRSSEFLWQEGHTAHATSEDAMSTAREMLDVYADVCEKVLAVPVVKGVKSPSERFAGADETFTIEALMQNGWALQSGTSHFLGQNFAKAFDVTFQDSDGGRSLVWATSWGVSTRLIGALVMTHSDDKGLVLPPAVAPVQVVIVPIMGGKKTPPEEAASVTAAVDAAFFALKAAGVKAQVDDREHLRPGAKYFEWERKGVPLRLEIGPKDVAKGAGVMKPRVPTTPGGSEGESEKAPVPLDPELLVAAVQAELEKVHSALLAAATVRLSAHTKKVDSFAEMEACFRRADELKVSGESGSGNGGPAGEGEDGQVGFFLVPWKCDAANEEAIKEATRATVRCYPLDLQHEAEGKACFYSGEPATHMAIFARAF